MATAVQRSYTLEEKERGLRELAECRGNRRLASSRLAERGVTVPHPTLGDWAKQQPDRYAELVVEVEDNVHRTIANEYESLALKGIEMQSVLLDDLESKRDELSGKELATALNSAATAAGIATDKSSALRGRPTVIVENRNPNELLQQLGSLIRPYIEGSAEEIAEVEVVSGEPAEGGVVVATEPDPTDQRAQD